jgi:hypothetical protein
MDEGKLIAFIAHNRRTDSIPVPIKCTSEDSHVKQLTIHTILLLMILICFGVPIFQAGFYHDDAAHSVLASRREVQHKSYGTFAAEIFRYMVLDQGRVTVFYPFMNLPIQMVIGDNLFLYHIGHGTLWGVALWSVLSLASTLGVGRRSVLILTLILALTQFRNFHDAVLNYFLFFPLLLISGAWTIIFYLRGITQEKRIYTWLWAPVMYLFGLLSGSEFMLCFFAIGCAVVLFEPLPLKRKILESLPLVGLTLLFVSLNLWLKSQGTVGYSGVQLGSAGAAGLAYMIQLVSVIPFSYLYLNPRDVMTHWQSDISLSQLAIALIGGTGIGVLVYRGLTEDFNIGHHGRRRMSLAGVVLLFASPLFTAVTKKYQAELQWGWGYLQVTFQVIGCAFLAVAFMSWLASVTIHRRKRYLAASICTALLAGLIFAGHSASNQVAVARLNSYYRTPRNLCKTMMRHYPFPEDKQSRPTLVIDAPWLNRWEIWEFYYQHTARRFSVTTWNDYVARGTQSQKNGADPSTEVYYLSCPRKISNNDGSFIVLARLSSNTPSPSKDSDWTLSDVMVATRSAEGTPYALVNPSGVLIALTNTYRSVGLLSEPCALYSTTERIPLDRSYLATPILKR